MGVKKIKKSTAILGIVVLFSCANNAKKVNDFLAEQNLPIGEAHQINHIHTDSGRVDTKLRSPLLLDFSNRENHPYSEFPKGIEVLTFNTENDSILIKGNFARSFSKTKVSYMKGDIEIYNYKSGRRLLTEQLFWDQNTKYFFTERKFVFYTKTDTIFGEGFEATQDLKKWWVKNQRGVVEVEEF